MIRRVFIYLYLSMILVPASFATQLREVMSCSRLLRIEKAPVFELHLDNEYIGMNLRYAPVADLRKRLQEKVRRKLLDRGEAHITIVTPPEFKALTKVLTPEALLAITTRVGGTGSLIRPICIGKGEAVVAGKMEQTYYIVVKAPVLLRIRHAIHSAFMNAGGKALDFKPNHFYPYITLGFTKHDLYEQDGVTKNSDSCVYPLTGK